MTETHIDLGTIGLFSLVGLPYTFKFLWAPIIDAIDVPLLSRWLGRRRGWLLFSQFLLVAAIVFLWHLLRSDYPLPHHFRRGHGRDGVGDAGHRGRRLPGRKPGSSEQGAGMAGYVAAYRIGMLASGAGVLVLVAASRTTVYRPPGASGCGAIVDRRRSRLIVGMIALSGDRA